MSRMWEIRESYGEKHRKSEVDEAYECGFEDGYESAMNENREDSSMGYRYRMGMRRETDREESGRSDSMGYRRSRDSMGRYK